MKVSPLEGVFAKLDRAQEHFDALNSEIAEYFLLHPTENYAEHDYTDGCEVLRIGKTAPLPVRWGVIVGDIVHNVRSSLDHLAWQLVIANGREPGVRTSFPICNTEHRWNERIVHRKEVNSPLRGMSPEAQALIETVQPFKGRDFLESASRTMLAGLESLWNCDKHRVVHVGQTFTTRDQAELMIEPPPPLTRFEWVSFQSDVEIVEGMEIGRVRILGRHPLAIHTEARLAVNMKITVGFRSRSEDPVATMNFLASSIVDVREIVRRFEPLLL